jgi:apolipoprotein N-acyltransferase
LPPFKAGIISCTALIPLFYYLKDRKVKEAFLGGFLMGLIWACGTVYWIAWATVLGFIGTLIVVPFYSAFFCMIMSFLYKKLGENAFWTAPFFWTGLEILSSWGPLAFPWNLLGYSLTSHAALIQHAEWGGAYGVSFWIVLQNVIFYNILNALKLRRGRTAVYYGAAAFLIILITIVHGSIILSKSAHSKSNIRIANIQGNIDPYRKWTPSFVDSNLALYRQLSFQSAEKKPDMIVWPETATACYLRNRLDRLSSVQDIADRTGAAVLTGSPDYDWIDSGNAKTYNTALYLQPNGDHIGRYHKMKLVPFSEKVPLTEWIPGCILFLKKWVLPTVILLRVIHWSSLLWIQRDLTEKFNLPQRFVMILYSLV